jgi:type I restriction enzyme, S subunit
MNGWKRTTLGEASQFINGLWKGEVPPFVYVGVIRNTNFTKDGSLDDSDIAYLDVEAKKFTKRRLQYGDLILEKSGGGPKQPVGRVVFFDKKEGDYSFSNFTAAIRVNDTDDLDPMYLHRYLHWVYVSGRTEAMQSHSTGIRNLNGDAYKGLTVDYPPLPEQRRIVAILDEAFEAIATAKANTEKNLLNARELFDSHLESVFVPSGSPGPFERLGQVCDFEGGSQPPKSEFIYTPRSGYVRFLQIRDFGSDRHETYIPEANKNRLCQESDILIGRYGASVGKILRGKAGAYNVALMKTVPNLSLVDPDFFYWYLSSCAFQSRLMNVAERSAQNGFSKEDILGFPVPLPSLAKQREIVDTIEPAHEEAQRLAEILGRKLTALDELKKALLHQAFTGQLTAKSTDKQLVAVA